MSAGRKCPDCGVLPGAPHETGCDVERCPERGEQRIGCGCVTTRAPLPWTGVWPGVAEAREFGWWCDKDTCRPCAADHPNATEDINRLAVDGRWDADAGRFVKRPNAAG